jgi:hypothetical protein
MRLTSLKASADAARERQRRLRPLAHRDSRERTRKRRRLKAGRQEHQVGVASVRAVVPRSVRPRIRAIVASTEAAGSVRPPKDAAVGGGARSRVRAYWLASDPWEDRSGGGRSPGPVLRNGPPKTSWRTPRRRYAPRDSDESSRGAVTPPSSWRTRCRLERFRSDHRSLLLGAGQVLEQRHVRILGARHGALHRIDPPRPPRLADGATKLRTLATASWAGPVLRHDP